MGHAGVGWVIQGWGGACRGVVVHAGMSSGGHTEVGWGGS